MSDHEINRFKVLTDVQEKRLRQVDAADILNVSTRHVRRLLNQLATYGAKSLAHAARGRPSNRRYDDNFPAEVLKIIALKENTDLHCKVGAKHNLVTW
ncbi:helix-turn-helix domain-containing protein [Vibrio fortis]